MHDLHWQHLTGDIVPSVSAVLRGLASPGAVLRPLRNAPDAVVCVYDSSGMRVADSVTGGTIDSILWSIEAKEGIPLFQMGHISRTADEISSAMRFEEEATLSIPTSSLTSRSSGSLFENRWTQFRASNTIALQLDDEDSTRPDQLFP